MERGNSRSSSRNSAAFRSPEDPPLKFREIARQQCVERREVLAELHPELVERPLLGHRGSRRRRLHRAVEIQEPELRAAEAASEPAT